MDTVIDMMDEINRVFETDPFWEYTKREPAFEAKSLHETLRKIETAASNMQQEARELRNSLYRRTIKKEDLVKATHATHAKLQATTTSFAGLLTDMDNNLAEVVERNKYQVKEYETEEYESGDANTYGIKVSLPGFKQDDVKVTISTENKNNKTFHRLEVTGTKQVTTATEEEKDVNGKKVTVKKASTQAFTSSTFVNGRQKVIEYKDGNIKIKFDLPNNIDTQDGKYTMSFDNETLKIEFPRQTKTTTKTPLKYTSIATK
jgi:HSP20 family molecular chaperone IbpA